MAKYRGSGPFRVSGLAVSVGAIPGFRSALRRWCRCVDISQRFRFLSPRGELPGSDFYFSGISQLSAESGEPEDIFEFGSNFFALVFIRQHRAIGKHGGE